MKLIRLTAQDPNLTYTDLVRSAYQYLTVLDHDIRSKETYIHYAEIPNGEKCVYVFNQRVNAEDKLDYIGSFDNIYACFRISGFIVIFTENKSFLILMNSSYDPEMHMAGFSVSDDSALLISTDIFDYLFNLDWP